MKKMNKNLKRLIAIGTLTGITEIYMNTFLSARIYELASSIQTLAMYYIVEYIFIAATFLIFGSKIKSKPLKALRFGIVLNLILIVFIMVVNEDITKYYIPFAILLGVAQGAYYSPFSVLVGTYNDNAVQYCTISSMLTNIISVLFPITIGAYINVSSFREVTVCMVLVSALQIAISLGIENVEVETKCDLMSFIKIIKNSDRIINYYKIGFLSGIVTSVLDRTVLVLIMLIFGSALQLGILSTVFATFTIITTWIIKRFYKKGKSRLLILISAVMPMIAVIVLVVDVSRGTVIFYKVIAAIFICILNLVASVERYDCLDVSLQKEYTTEHQTFAETVLAAGRVFGLSILLILSSLIGGLYAIMIMLIFISFSIIAYAYLIVKQ